MPDGSMGPADVTWSEVEAGELDARTLYDVLELRSAVFVVEQACAYQDVDGLDLVEGTRHVIGRQGAIAAYARVLAPDEGHPTPRIGRVIVAPGSRGQQLARPLMRRALEICAVHWPGQPVELGAQAHLAGFYGSLGFLAVSEPYDEDGIPHVWMRRPPG
jgi:ElaA protein